MKQVTIDQTITARIGAVRDRAGNPAEVEGPWSWETDSDTVTLQPSADSTSCVVVTGDQTDEIVNITAVADADLGEGVQEIIAVFEPLVIVGGTATFVEATFDNPTSKV